MLHNNINRNNSSSVDRPSKLSKLEMWLKDDSFEKTRRGTKCGDDVDTSNIIYSLLEDSLSQLKCSLPLKCFDKYNNTSSSTQAYFFIFQNECLQHSKGGTRARVSTSIRSHCASSRRGSSTANASITVRSALCAPCSMRSCALAAAAAAGGACKGRRSQSFELRASRRPKRASRSTRLLSLLQVKWTSDHRLAAAAAWPPVDWLTWTRRPRRRVTCMRPHASRA